MIFSIPLYPLYNSPSQRPPNMPHTLLPNSHTHAPQPPLVQGYQRHTQALSSTGLLVFRTLCERNERDPISPHCWVGAWALIMHLSQVQYGCCTQDIFALIYVLIQINKNQHACCSLPLLVFILFGRGFKHFSPYDIFTLCANSCFVQILLQKGLVSRALCYTEQEATQKNHSVWFTRKGLL